MNKMLNWDHKLTLVLSPKEIGPKTVENGDNHSTAPKRNMERSARGNFVQ